MILDKLLLASDVGLTMLISDDTIDSETEDEMMNTVGKLQVEVKNIMDWLMSEKKILIETTNPIPESDTLGDRRRRNNTNST